MTVTATLPAGYTIAPTPTNYRGKMMRSRLEASFAEQLDAIGIAWEHEPFVLASQAGQWYPDFRIATADGARVYVEVRPTPELARRDLARYATIARECDPAALVIAAGFVDGDPLQCMTVDGRTVRIIGPRQPPPPTERAALGSRALPDTGPRYGLLPAPAALRRRASEHNRLDKITRDLPIFRTPGGRGFSRVNGLVAIPLVSSAAEPTIADKVSAIYADVYGRPPSREKLTEHLEQLTERCTVVEEVCHGVARLDDDRWVLDLGPGEGPRIVTIGPTGWRLSAHSPLPLYRHEIHALPTPTPGGHVDDLYDMLNVHEDDFEAFVDVIALCYLPGHKAAHRATRSGQPMSKTFPRRGGADAWTGSQCGPLDFVLRMVRSNIATILPNYMRDPHPTDVEIRFVGLHGVDEAKVVVNAMNAVAANTDRIVGALLERAVAIVAGPHELAAPPPAPPPALEPPALDDAGALALVLETFPDSIVMIDR